jgi:hypothetical protein
MSFQLPAKVSALRAPAPGKPGGTNWTEPTEPLMPRAVSATTLSVTALPGLICPISLFGHRVSASTPFGAYDRPLSLFAAVARSVAVPLNPTTCWLASRTTPIW